jgi:hypothetical protein
LLKGEEYRGRDDDAQCDKGDSFTRQSRFESSTTHYPSKNYNKHMSGVDIRHARMLPVSFADFNLGLGGHYASAAFRAFADELSDGREFIDYRLAVACLIGSLIKMHLVKLLFCFGVISRTPSGASGTSD